MPPAERELPGFDEKRYVAGARFNEVPLSFLLEDYVAVRDATLTLFAGFSADAWRRRGIVNAYSASARGLAFHIAGHELHHLRIVRERYVPIAESQPWWRGANAGAANR